MKLTGRIILHVLVGLGMALTMLTASAGLAAPLLTCTSVGDGLWSAPATWSGCEGKAPQVGDDVIIDVGHSVTLDDSPVVLGSLTVNGSLIIGDDATVRTVTVSGDLNIGSGGAVEPGGVAAAHSLWLEGDLLNNGELNGFPGSGRTIDLTVAGIGDHNLSGTGITVLNKVTMNLSSSTDRLTVSTSVTIKGGTDSIVWNMGIWDQSTERLTFSTGNQGLTADGHLVLSGSGNATFPSSITGGGSSSTNGVTGKIEVNTTGDLTIGNGNNRLQINSGGSADFIAGTISINGRLTLNGGSTVINRAIILIDPQGSYLLGGDNPSMYVGGTANLNMIGGSIALIDPKENISLDIQIVSDSGTKSLTGGTFRLGDGISSSPAEDDGFQLDLGGYTLPNLTIERQQGSNRFVVLDGTTTVAGTVVNNGALMQPSTLGKSTSFHFGQITDGASTDKYKGVQITTDASSDLGFTTVKVYGNQNTSGSTGTPVNRWFQIYPANAGTANLTFHFLCTELQGAQAPDNVKVWRYDGSSWADLGNDTSSACDDDGYGSVTVNSVDLNATEDTFVLKIFNPLAVNLETFTATPELDAGQVRVVWETVNEVDNQGFYLYRATSADGPWVQLSPNLIPSQSPGSPWGFAYEWVDRDVIFGERYLYRLASMDMAGLAEVVDTTEAQYGEWQRVWLPLVGR